MSVADAGATANATAGQSVIFAGSAVLLAICGLFLSSIHHVATMGDATALAVACVVVTTTVTLLPALLGLAGRRLQPRQRSEGRHAQNRTPLSGSWPERVGRRPLPYALAALGVLLTLAAPTLSKRLGITDAGVQPESNTVRRAYDLTDRGFGVGANTPLVWP